MVLRVQIVQIFSSLAPKFVKKYWVSRALIVLIKKRPRIIILEIKY